ATTSAGSARPRPRSSSAGRRRSATSGWLSSRRASPSSRRRPGPSCSRTTREGALAACVPAVHPLSLKPMGKNRHRFLLGTYTQADSRGIYCADLDGRNGAIGPAVLAAQAPNPTFLALSPDGRLVYAVCAGPAWASSFRVDPSRAALAPVQ